MIQFFYSSDLGLLNEKIDLFKSVHKDHQAINDPSIDEIHIALTQQTIFVEIKNYIFSRYSADLTELADVLSEIKDADVNVLVTVESDYPVKVPMKLKKLLSNNDICLKKLNSSGKRSFISKCIKKYGIKLDPQFLELLSMGLPQNAEMIDAFFKDLCLYQKTEPINEESINFFLSSYNNEIVYFEFFKHYFLSSPDKWLKIINNPNLVGSNLRAFLKIFCYKLNSFSAYLEDRSKYTAKGVLQKQVNPPKNLYYVYAEFEKILLQHRDIIHKYLNTFLLDFFIFTEKILYSKVDDIKALQYFFLDKHIENYI